MSADKQDTGEGGVRCGAWLDDVHLGDRYHRNGKVVAVTAIDADTVTCELTDSAGTYSFTVSRPEFARLERKSLEWGAVFEPSSNEKLSD